MKSRVVSRIDVGNGRLLGNCLAAVPTGGPEFSALCENTVGKREDKLSYIISLLKFAIVQAYTLSVLRN